MCLWTPDPRICLKMSTEFDRLVYKEFYDLVAPKRPRKKKTCLRCGAPTIDVRVCNKCRKFIDGQSRMAQDGGFEVTL